MTEERFLRYHDYTRRRGVNWPMYLLARLLLQPFFLLYFRLRAAGREHARVKGGLIVAANHRSFLDPFVIGASLPWRKPMNYVAKVELFEKRWQAWFLSRLGAFPIRRGEADEEAMKTARMAVERGGTVCIFPEGTRIRTGSLSTPKRGVGRLALQTGAAVVPVAVLGTERVPRRLAHPPAQGAAAARQGDDLPALRAPLAGARRDRHLAHLAQHRAAVGGPRRAAADPPRRGDRRRQLGNRRGGAARPRRARGAARHALLRAGGRPLREARELALPAGRRPSRLGGREAVGEIELAGIDLVCLAIPSKSLPQAVGAIADQIGQRTAVLLLTKGLVAPLGQLPSEYVGERVRARAISCLGGPAHAREAVSGSAALVLGTADPDLRTQLSDVFDRAGLVCETLVDVIGVEVAGAAKNAAALAAAAAEPHGLNAAGIAAAEIWRECVEYGVGRGADLRTFTGLAGVGDLTATVLAPSSRNRRAGELLGQGTPAEQIPQIIGQASEGLDSVPLIAQTISAAGADADGLNGLAALVRGEIGPEAWVAGLRRAERSRRAA